VRDLSHLPKATPEQRAGLAPDQAPRFIGVLADRWAADKDDNKPTALGTAFRHSDAGKCARYLSYVAAGLEPSDPMDMTGVWNTSLGTLIHELWQDALVERWPDAEVEVKCRTQGVDGSGHIDAVIRENGTTVSYELKTVGGYGFKASVGAARKGAPAEGPKGEHIIQAALNGLAVDADEVVIGYLSKECLSVNVAGRFGITDDLSRFAAEWTFTRDQYEPLALEEAARVDAVLALVADGKAAPRRVPGDMPKGAEVADPSTGAWLLRSEDVILDTGSTWQCGYCKYQTLCATTQPGIVPLDQIATKKEGEA
jgi:hypothetical protein